MVVTKCPSCEKEVTVPPGARAESRVRCPLCSAEHSLQEVIKDLPPLLELLDAPRAGASHILSDSVLDGAEHPADADTQLASGEPVMAEASSGGIFKFDDGPHDDQHGEHGDFAMSDPEERTAPGSFDFGGGGGTATAVAPAMSAGTGTMSATARPRPKKKAANPAIEIVKVVLGGVIALPIAQMILWWLPGDWKRDPMELAPKLPSYVAFLAPASLRDPGSVDESAPTEEENAAASFVPPQVAENNTKGGNSFGRDDLAEALRNSKNGDDPKPEVDPGEEGPNEAPFDVEPPDLGTKPKPEEPPGGEVAIDPPVSVEPKSPEGPKDAPKYEKADLAKPLESAKAAANNLTEAADQSLEQAARVKKINDFKAAMFDLAHHVAYTPERGEGYDEHLSSLLGELAATPKNLNAIGNLAQQRLADKQRSSDGILLVGSVKEIQPRGQLFETVVELNVVSKRPVSIYSVKDPSAALKAGDVVIIMGAIIDDPLEKLTGYKGPDEPVVWGGFSQVVE